MTQPASPLSVGSLTQLTLSLIAIVLLIIAISWALKRLKLAGPRGRGNCRHRRTQRRAARAHRAGSRR
jgi:flagellar biogenesis protein FliO